MTLQSGPLHCQPRALPQAHTPGTWLLVLLVLLVLPPGPACTWSPSPGPEHPGRQRRSQSQACGVMAGDKLCVAETRPVNPAQRVSPAPCAGTWVLLSRMTWEAERGQGQGGRGSRLSLSGKLPLEYVCELSR